MRIDHLIVGASDVESSCAFYRDLLGFRKTDDDPGAAGGAVLAHGHCELLVLPFERTPNPAHFAFRVDTAGEFEELVARAEAMGLRPRSLPRRDSRPGPGELRRNGRLFRMFYVSDPSGVNVEVMVQRE